MCCKVYLNQLQYSHDLQVLLQCLCNLSPLCRCQISSAIQDNLFVRQKSLHHENCEHEFWRHLWQIASSSKNLSFRSKLHSILLERSQLLKMNLIQLLDTKSIPSTLFLKMAEAINCQVV